MNLIKKRVYGYYDDCCDRMDEYFDRRDEGDWYWEMMLNPGDNFEYLEEVKEDLATIKQLIDSDFKDLSDEHFYHLISRFYYVDLSLNDFLNIISRVNHVQYDKFEELRTRQTYKIQMQEGHGKDLSWWPETYEAGWIVATAKNFRLKSNYNYSNQEIENMIKNKKIVFICEHNNAVGMEPKLPYEEEEYKVKNIPKIECYSKNIKKAINSLILHSYHSYDEYMKYVYPCIGKTFNFGYLKEGKTRFSKAVYKEACSMIRIRLNKKQVLKDCKRIILFLNNELNYLIPHIQKSYFDVYADKDKYLNLLEKLKNNHKTLLLKLEEK